LTKPSEYIRVIKSTNFDYFSYPAKKIFFKEEFKVTKLTDRMGMRIEGRKLENIINSKNKDKLFVKYFMILIKLNLHKFQPSQFDE
jgi:allophanate hydrolase subunit 2